MFLIRMKTFVNNINRIIDEIIKNSLFPNQLAVLGPLSTLPSGSKSFIPDLKKILEDGFVWMPTPKKRMSAEKKIMRKLNENPSSGINKWGKPKTNIVACLTCGDYHEIGSICGKCYEKVREETKLMMKEFESKIDHVHPTNEIAYVYQNEENNKEMLKSKNKFIVEIPKERPKWFNNNLFTKVTTKK